MKRRLIYVFNELAELAGYETSSTAAIEKGHTSFLHLEQDKLTGYRMVRVNSIKGNHFGVFGKPSTEARISAKEMIIRIEGLIDGINFAKENK